MNSQLDGKVWAARAAASLVESGMVVGLGSGSTAAEFVRILGDRARDEGLEVLGVPTSVATASLANALRLPLRDVDDVATVDLMVDGADEVSPTFQMIKGRGGALLREKIVATVARRRVIVVTPEKRVERLGETAPLPIEVCPVGARHLEARLRDLGADPTVRARPDGAPYQTDGGNKIIDCRFAAILDPDALDAALQRLVGVYETGLFLGLCDLLIVGHSDRAELVQPPGMLPAAQ